MLYDLIDQHSYCKCACRVSSIFSLGGKLQKKPSPWSLFLHVQGGTLLEAHSYAKKEGLGMRLLQSLVGFGVSPCTWSTLPSFTFTLNHISGMQILGGEAPVVWGLGGGGGGGGVEHFGGEASPALCSPPPWPLRSMKPWHVLVRCMIHVNCACVSTLCTCMTCT